MLKERTLEDLNKFVFTMLGILLVLVAFSTIVLFQKDFLLISLLDEFLVFSFTFIVGILALISSGVAVLRKVTIILFSVIGFSISSIPPFSIQLLILVPAILSLYTSDKKFIFSMFALNFILFIGSRHIYISLSVDITPITTESIPIVYWGTFFAGIIDFSIITVILLPLFIHILELSIRQQKVIKEKELAYDEILRFCSTATSYHDKYLRVHLLGVRELSRILLDGLIEKGYKISKDYYNNVLFSVQFHDIGKIYIDPGILNKDASLSESEYDLIKQHPIRGLDLFNLVPTSILNDELRHICCNIIIQHHERLDGSGYPRGLKKDELSLESQIVAVADVTDALLSWRPYKNPFTWNTMKKILENSRGRLNDDCIDIILSQEQKILELSDKNNILLKEELHLSDIAILR